MRRISPLVFDRMQNNRALEVDGAGAGGRSSEISRRISVNRVLEVATSAIWKATGRPWLTTFATILMSYTKSR